MVGRRCQNSEYMVPRICLFLLMIHKACGFEMLYQEARTRKEGLRGNGSEEVVSITLVEFILPSKRSGSPLHNLTHSIAIPPISNTPLRWRMRIISKVKYRIVNNGKQKKGRQRRCGCRSAVMSAYWSPFDETLVLIFLISDAIRSSFADEVNAALSSAPSQQSTWDEGEDPDDWLEITQRDLEKSLNAYMSTEPHNSAYATQDTSMGEAEEDGAATEQAARLKRLAEKVDAFVEGKGDLSGAMFEE